MINELSVNKQYAHIDESFLCLGVHAIGMAGTSMYNCYICATIFFTSASRADV